MTPQVFPNGVIPPIITPLRPDFSIDTESLARVVRRLVDAGSSAIFALGSTGDASYLSDSDRMVVARTAVAAAGKVPVVAGVIEMSASRVHHHARRLVDSGVSGVVVTAPLYGLNDDDELRSHFRQVAAGLGVPVIAYDIPVRGLRKLPAKMLIELALDGVISGLKDSSTDVSNLRSLVELNEDAGNPLSIYSGLEIFGDAAAAFGLNGTVPGLSNIDPLAHVHVWNESAAGRSGSIRHVQRRLVRLYDVVHQSPRRSRDVSGTGGFKVALKQLGVIEHATVPLPLAPLDPETVRKIEHIVDQYGPDAA